MLFQEGPIYSKHIIRGIRLLEYGQELPSMEVVSGGIGRKHAKIILISRPKQTSNTIVLFHGEKIDKI